MDTLTIGDYVLATKYNDGSSKDQWSIGFYGGTTDHSPVRYEVVDDYGGLMRGNGFRRCERIEAHIGEYLLLNKDYIDSTAIPLWDVVHQLTNQ